MSGLELLETERLVLSGWRHDQVDELVRLHGDAEISRYLSASGAPWSRQQCAEALAGYVELYETRQLGKLRATRKSDGVLVGRAGFGMHEGEPELGYALYREFWGQGYASEAALGLRDWFFDGNRGERFLGVVDVRNAASLKVLHRVGMVDTYIGDYEGAECQYLEMRKPA